MKISYLIDKEPIEYDDNGDSQYFILNNKTVESFFYNKNTKELIIYYYPLGPDTCVYKYVNIELETFSQLVNCEDSYAYIYKNINSAQYQRTRIYC